MALAIFCCAVVVAKGGAALSQGARKAEQNAPGVERTLEAGRQVFASRCAGCHGLDGRGTERAPAIATDARVQRRTDAALRRAIQNGVPAAGMPAFSMLDDATTKSLVAYVRFLQGKRQSSRAPGNAQRGQSLFFGKARCAECHMVKGKGGFIASDLSAFGSTHSAEETRRAILSPEGSGTRGEVMVVKTRDGQQFSGVVRNEDNFSLQLQTMDGGFQLFLKADVESAAREAGSLMPSDYASTLNSSEIDDLVSFVVRVGGPAREKVKVEDWEE
ncbi:MAG TPA: c-type cytochrome [Candidatus Acidoferrum sp.]|nr:c-type cytochrome [Candidatus Acidoferrum sp.]